MSFAIGSLVRARGREWVVLPESEPDLVIVRPLGGTDDEIAGIHLGLETVVSATLALPGLGSLGDYRSGRLLRDAVRLGFRNSAGPFRSFGRIGCEPRPYQLVPLLLALRLNPIRLLIADDVGIGKTIEASLIARELLDRGEVQRLAVLCPPHLAEQWQKELREKFNLDAELVLASTARRLESGIATNQSLFDVYPHVIVSTDYIKSDRRREDFLRACPELVIVDEAHTCASGVEAGSGRHQRHHLLKGLAADPNRHLILVTATPHSGKEDAFRSLLTLLDPQFASLPDDLAGSANEVYRRRLAAHLVQRRRGDIEHYLNADTPFPKRLEKEQTYTLSAEYRRLFDKALRYAREIVRDPEGGQFRQRVRWWSALALLRSLASSPAAAAETLRNRASSLGAETIQEADEIGRRTILDAVDDDAAEGTDVAPGSGLDEETDADRPGRKRLLDMARDADALKGTGDAKLQEAKRIVQQLVTDGFNPIVFCRFIPTAEYLADELRSAMKGVEVAAVTGSLSSADRESRVTALGKVAKHVLVCTDCLSEGINLQEHFDAVMHYDLSWNPTRHEQREGRVDRYGQNQKVVRVVTYYGTDNHIDGVVLDVLLRKHKTIRNALGISVPVPVDTETMMAAILHGALLRGDVAQLSFEFPASATEQIHNDWEASAAREKRSQTMFAQHSVKPDEVARELAAVRQVIGSQLDVERFVREIVEAHGGRATRAAGDGIVTFDLSETPRAMRDAARLEGEDGVLRAKFGLPVPDSVAYLQRTHPIVEGLASYVMDSALDPLLAQKALARRAGVVRTQAVKVRTVVLLLRLRYHIISRTASGENELLAEDWQLVAFRGAPAAADWLSRDDAEALFDAAPEANIAIDIALTHLHRVLEELPDVRAKLDTVAHDRGAEILDAHRRVRKAAKVTGMQQRIEAKLPVDVLGVYLYLPGNAK